MSKPKTLTLEEYTDEMIALDELSDMDSGEWTDDHQALLEEITAKIAEKADNFWMFRETLRAQATNAKAVAARIADKASRIEKRVEYLDSYMMAQMDRMGRPFFEGKIWRIRKQPNSTPSVAIGCLPGALPAEYQRVIPEVVEANKVAITAALKAGIAVEHCELTYGYHLRAA